MRLQEADPRWHNPLAWAPGKFGDRSAAIPGGLYASDRDVFAFTVQIEDSRNGYTRGERVTTFARKFVKKAPSRGSAFIHVSTLPPAIY